MTLSDDCSGSIGLREDFAKHCFETLLEFSLLVHSEILFGDFVWQMSLKYYNLFIKDTEVTESDSSVTNRLAITSLLQRFKEVFFIFDMDFFDKESLMIINLKN